MHDSRKSLVNSALRKVLKRLHYPLSLRHIEEMMQERGVSVDHATVIAGVETMHMIRKGQMNCPEG